MDLNQWEERRLETKKRETDVRTEWDRDNARIIHSSAFRRLQSKTQVLGLGESDFYRTRLTHSMEVAQIGIGITTYLRKKISDQNLTSILPSSALIGSICLAHDLGHPPFGHGGEIALNICMRGFGGFEGNGQTLRILSKLEKYSEEHGLNPTRRLMLGVLKYPASYSATVNKERYGDIQTPKWLNKSEIQKPPKCYLDDEIDVVNWILNPFCDEAKATFTSLDLQVIEHHKTKFKSLDTSIMELADDISYTLHDLEDAISLGLVTKSDWDEHFSSKGTHFFDECDLDIEQIRNDLFADSSYQRKGAIGNLVNKFITSAIPKEYDIFSNKNKLLRWNIALPAEAKALQKAIFELTKNKVILSPNVQQLEFKGQKLVVDLFEILASDPKRLLPKDAKSKFDKADDEQKKMRVICDFIAGMTDEYATRFYEKLCYPHKGSIFDRL